MDEDDRNKKVGELFDYYWPTFKHNLDVKKTFLLHFGFYEKGIKTHQQAILNMNDFIGKLLGLKKKKSAKILDAGCGVGGVSIYLAKKFPNISFTGITIAPEQVKLAKKFSKHADVESNTSFLLQNFLETGFPDNYFDGVFAIESSSYAENHQDFVDELHRILKPGGKLVIIDVFRKKKTINHMMQKIYREFCGGFGNINPPTISNHRLYLQKEKGFKNINVQDITKNIAPSLLKVVVKNLFSFTERKIKRVTNMFGKASSDKKERESGATFWAAILGFFGIIGYYAVIGVK